MFEEGTILNIANVSLQLHPKYGQAGLTYSAVLCPLIYNSLKIAGINVMDVWSKLYFESDDGNFKLANEEINLKFQNYSNKIANTSGWVNYALYILTEYDYKDNLEPEFYEDIFAESKRIITFLKENGKL
jgi:hypothetical protein